MSPPGKEFLILVYLLIFSISFAKSNELEIPLKIKTSFQDSNSFIGSMPDFSSLINLSFLNLNASGVFPWKSLQNLTSLLHFPSVGDYSFEASEVLKVNKLDYLAGKFPAGCGNLTSLYTLYDSANIYFLLGLAFLVICFFFFFFKKLRNHQLRFTNSKAASWSLKSFHKLGFHEQEILNSIKQENLIGEERSGNVYTVYLNGIKFAVKHFFKSDSSSDRKDNRSTGAMLRNLLDFDTEVETFSSICHVNVVKHYCNITSKDSVLLVYEYLPNGSLWERLHICNQKTGLDWQTRYNIAVGSAKGLEYLHYGCDRAVIHCDLKSTSILLDEFFKPRIANAGLANLLLHTDLMGYCLKGTHGYIAPEYACGFKANEKSDVYSFGVVLMELVTGKKPVYEPEFGENKDIVHWVRTQMATRESILGMVDTIIPATLQEEAVKVLRVAALCTAGHPDYRPSMREVVQMLEDAEPYKLVSITVDTSYITEKDKMKTKRLKH